MGLWDRLRFRKESEFKNLKEIWNQRRTQKATYEELEKVVNKLSNARLKREMGKYREKYRDGRLEEVLEKLEKEKRLKPFWMIVAAAFGSILTFILTMLFL